MFISQEELKKRLESNTNLNNILNPDEKEKLQAEKDLKQVIEGVILNREESIIGQGMGKKKGDENVPQMFREIVAAQAQFGKGTEIAKSYGLSTSEVSHLKNGIPNRKNLESESNKGVQAVIEKVTGRIRDKICEKIEMALDTMTADKFENEQSLKNLATITANLARTQQALENKDKNANIDARVQTIIYAPQAGELSDYTELQVAR